MNDIDTGGPAFPIVAHHEVHHLGTTLRDYFAAKALSSTFYPAIMESIRIDKDLDANKVAEFAYVMADAMLAARGGK